CCSWRITTSTAAATTTPTTRWRTSTWTMDRRWAPLPSSPLPARPPRSPPPGLPAGPGPSGGPAPDSRPRPARGRRGALAQNLPCGGQLDLVSVQIAVQITHTSCCTETCHPLDSCCLTPPPARMTGGQFERASREARAHENPQRAKDWALPSLARRARCGCQVARRVNCLGDGRAGWKSQKDEGAGTTMIQGDELVLLTLPPTKVPPSVGEALHVPKKRAVWASTARSDGGRTTASPLG